MDMTERTQMKGRLRVVGKERRLPPDVEVAIFRVVQESLRNAERHSRGTRVGITMDFTEAECRLHVSDDGIGFALPARPSDFAMRSQLGLLGMQERVELVGGRFEVRSRPGNGTTLTVPIPSAGAGSGTAG